MELNRRNMFEKLLASIAELNRCFATNRDAFLAQFKLSRPQLELLFSIKHGERSTGEIAKLFSITSSAVSQMVDQLERKSLVERFTKPADRRVTYIKLAPEARRAFDTVRAKYVDHFSERFTDISDTELQSLLNVLDKTINHVGKEAAWKK